MKSSKILSFVISVIVLGAVYVLGSVFPLIEPPDSNERFTLQIDPQTGFYLVNDGLKGYIWKLDPKSLVKDPEAKYEELATSKWELLKDPGYDAKVLPQVVVTGE